MRTAPLTLVYSATVPTLVPAYTRPIPYSEQITNNRTENARWKLLIVEDYMPVRKLLNVFLTNHGYETVVASSGSEAQALTHFWTPDVMLMDLVLPDAIGVDLVASLRKQYVKPTLPAIFLATSSHSTTIHRTIAYDSSIYFAQPSDLTDIHELIHRLLQDTKGMVE